MNKEIIICIIIFIIVLGLNNITQNYTNKTVEEVKEYLNDTRGELTKEKPDYGLATKKAEDMFNKWEELDDIMAFYIEHDEIEKVTTAITSARSFTKLKHDVEAVERIDTCKYILDHIDEREKFTLDNIF